MGKPDEIERVVRFEVDDLALYVAWELMQKLEPGAQQMTFYVDGYGRFRLVFVEPWTEVEGG